MYSNKKTNDLIKKNRDAIIKNKVAIFISLLIVVLFFFICKDSLKDKQCFDAINLLPVMAAYVTILSALAAFALIVISLLLVEVDKMMKSTEKIKRYINRKKEKLADALDTVVKDKYIRRIKESEDEQKKIKYREDELKRIITVFFTCFMIFIFGAIVNGIGSSDISHELNNIDSTKNASNVEPKRESIVTKSKFSRDSTFETTGTISLISAIPPKNPTEKQADIGERLQSIFVSSSCFMCLSFLFLLIAISRLIQFYKLSYAKNFFIFCKCLATFAIVWEFGGSVSDAMNGRLEDELHILSLLTFPITLLIGALIYKANEKRKRNGIQKQQIGQHFANRSFTSYAAICLLICFCIYFYTSFAVQGSFQKNDVTKDWVGFVFVFLVSAMFGWSWLFMDIKIEADEM